MASGYGRGITAAGPRLSSVMKGRRLTSMALLDPAAARAAARAAALWSGRRDGLPCADPGIAGPGVSLSPGGEGGDRTVLAAVRVVGLAEPVALDEHIGHRALAA